MVTPPPNARTIRGLVQKGAFLDLRVNARIVDELGQTIDTVPATINGQEYSVAVPAGAFVMLEALGRFTDEITGLPVRLNEPLTAINVGAEQHNINIITTLIASRTVGRVVNGEGMAEAAAAARGEILFALRFSQAETLDLSQAVAGGDPADDNVRLALLSVAVMSLPRERPRPADGRKLLEPGEPGRMSTQWDDLNAFLRQGGEFDATVFNQFAGMSAADLGAVLSTTKAEGDDAGWTCQTQCDFEPANSNRQQLYVAATQTREGRGLMPITVRRQGPNAIANRVVVALEELDANLRPGYGAATQGADYADRLVVIELAAGVDEATVQVSVVVDNIDEGNGEQLRARIVSSSEASDFVQPSAKVTILEGLPPIPADATDTGAVGFVRDCLVAIGFADSTVEQPCLNPIPQSLVLLADLPQVVRVVGVLQGDCLRAGQCPERERDWMLDAVLVGDAAEVALGRFLYPGEAVLMARSTPQDRPQFEVSLDSPGVRELIAANGSKALRVELRLLGQSASVASIPLPSFLALDGRVMFGDRLASIAGANARLLDDPSCPDGQRLQASVLAGDEAATALLPEGFAALLSAVPASQADVCVAVGGGPRPQATVSACSAATPDSDCSVNLPFGLWPAPTGLATRLSSESGATRAALPIVGHLPARSSAPTELVIEGLPLSFALSGLTLDAQGLILKYSALRHLNTALVASDDPRVNGAGFANDWMFSQGGAGGSLRVPAANAGLSTTLNFNAGIFSTTWPETRLSWPNFSLSLNNNQLDPIQLSNVSATVQQNTDCLAGDCPLAELLPNTTTGNLLVTGAGTSHGQMSPARPNQIAGFGERLPVAGERQFSISRNDLQQDSTANLALPGYRFDPALPVVAQLPAHIQRGGDQLALHDTRSNDFRDGNFFPAGLSLGPERYISPSRRPEIGTLGQDLSEAGRALALNGGGNISAFATTTAAKYVLRRSGMTGVFNVDPAALVAPANLYGYDASFSRFAFRFVDNEVDPYTWIDGEIRLQGDYADFDGGVGTPISFLGLQMDCSAQFGQGNLAFEICDELDNNANGVVDENCPAPLLAFDMTSRLQGMRFGNPDGEAIAACGDADVQLLLSQAIEPLAIDEPLSVELAWTPAGRLPEPGYQKFRGLKSYRFEAGEESEGYGLRLLDANLRVDEVTQSDIQGSLGPRRLGRVNARAQMALPFWESLDTDLRMENVSLGALQGPRAATSVIAPRGVIVTGGGRQPPLPLERYNADLQAAIQEQAQSPDNRNADFQIDPNTGHAPALVHFGRYTWVGGVGFRLPVFYRSAIEDDALGRRRLPTFLGVERDFEKLGFGVKSGINFIEPERTKISFGASADFTALGELEFQIDLFSLRGLQKVDNTLLDLRVIKQPVFEPTFGGLSRRLTAFTDFANAGIDNLTRKALISSVEALGQRSAEVSPTGEDPIVSLSRGLNVVGSFPQQLSGALRSQIESPLIGIIDSAKAALRDTLTALLAPRFQNQNDPLPAEALNQIEALVEELEATQEAIEGRKANIDQHIVGLLGLVDRVQTELTKVDTARKRVSGILNQAVGVVAEVCAAPDQPSGVELGGHLQELFKGLDGARQTLAIVSGQELLGPLIDLAVKDPTLATAIREGQTGLQRTATLLEDKLAAAEVAIKSVMCAQGNVTQLLVNVDRELRDIGNQVALIDAGLTQLKTPLTELQNFSAQLDQLLLPTKLSIGALKTALTQISEEDGAENLSYAQLERQVIAALADTEQLPAEIVLSPDTSIPIARPQVLFRFDDATPGPDLVEALFLPLESLIAVQINTIELAAQNAVGRNLPAVWSDPDELRALLVEYIMDTAPIVELRRISNLFLAEIYQQLVSLMNQIADQANRVVAGALAGVNEKIDGALDKAKSGFQKIPLASAGLDGYAVITGAELERLHIGAEFELKKSTDGQKAIKFSGALDAVSWNANGKTDGCNVDESSSLLDVMISAYDLPAKLGGQKFVVKKIYFGFAMDQAPDPESSFRLKGVFGGISTQAKFRLSGFKIYDPAFAGGAGAFENYLGATAQGTFSSVSAELAFLLGKTCNQDVLLELDPNVARYIPLPDSGFAGFYIRGAAGFPLLEGGCPLNVSMSAEVGAWVLGGPPVTVGGLVGGAAYGKVACVGALRGQIRAIGQINTDGEASFVGEGFGAAGAGFCEPETWTSLERSRADGACATFDAFFSAGYQDKWKIFGIGVGGPH